MTLDIILWFIIGAGIGWLIIRIIKIKIKNK